MGKKGKKGGATGKRGVKRVKMDSSEVEGSAKVSEGSTADKENKEGDVEVAGPSNVVPEVPEQGVGEPEVPEDLNGRLYNEEHPMLNPMLLMKVLEYYDPDIEDFRVLRQVCKCWYDVTFDLWRSKFVLRLTEETEVFRERQTGGISVGEFLRRFEDPDDAYQLASNPYVNYSFTELTIDMNISDKEGTECKRFWDGVGPLMEYVHFNRCFFATGQYMAFEQLVIEKLPNLQTLAITDTGKVNLPSGGREAPYVHRQKQEDRVIVMKEKMLGDHLGVKTLLIYGGIPVRLKRLIAKIPNLENLQIRNSMHTSAMYDESLMDLLIFLRKQRILSNHSKYNLKVLDLMHTKVFYSWFSITRVLNQVRFPLTTLSVEIKPDQSLNHQALKPLMEPHAATLKILKVFCPPLSSTTYHDTFPFDINLEVLEELHLFGNVTRSFKFLKWMPNLKKVLVDRYCVEKWEEVTMQQKEISHMGWFHPNHRTYLLPFGDDMVQKTGQETDMEMVVAGNLEVLRVDCEFSEESLRVLRGWMPNLKVLWTVVSKRSLGTVVEAWPGLRQLRCMFQSDLDDEAVTGWKFGREGEAVEQGEGKCLVDLEDLRKIQIDSLCGKSKITDNSVHLGFLKMPRLEAMLVCVSSKLTPQMEAVLKSRIPYVRLIRNYGKKPHMDPVWGNNPTGFCCYHKRFFDTLRSDAEAHRTRQNALERARERRRARREVAADDLASTSSSSSDSEDSDSDRDDPVGMRMRFGGGRDLIGRW